MIEVVCGSVRDLLLAKIALLGEIPYSERREVIYELSETSLNTGLSIAKRQDKTVVVRRKNDTIRLSSGAGLKLLKEFSEDMYERYMLITGGHRLSGNQKHSERSMRKAKSIMHAARNGFLIDGIHLTYAPSPFEKRTDKIRGCKFRGAGEILKYIEPGESVFFTAPCIKAIDLANTKKLATTRASGIALTDKEVFVAYNVGNGSFRTYIESEQAIKEIAESIASATIGSVPSKGLFICDSDDDIYRLLRRSKKNKFRLTFFFQDYVVISDSKEGDAILKARKTNIVDKIYYTEEQRQGKIYDAVVNGLPSFEFCTGNYGKIERIQKHGLTEAHIICFEQQKEVIRKLLPGVKVTFDCVPLELVEESEM